ncbi:MAG TPA: prepilin-type N-terminal cleavage/methylation domain-containing protein [bacterium]|nr:prepilin-type N-terminal cleavage/methylation domain-containing protein [bacterium]
MSRRGGVAGITSQRGFTLIELVIAAALLGGVVMTFYFMVTTTTRGWLLLQGQLDIQQNPRVASDRVVNDLQQATGNTVTGTLTIQKATIIVCPVTPSGMPAGTIIIQNPTDLVTGTVVTLTALATGISPTTVSAVGGAATCALNGVTGTQLTITPTLTSATVAAGIPYGMLLGPIAVSYTSSGTQMTRAGQPLADLVSSLSFTGGVSSTLSANSPWGVTTPTVASTAGFAVGDLIFIGSELRSIVSIAGSTLNLDQGLFVTHTSGTPVRKNIVTMQIANLSRQTTPSGAQVQLVTDTTEGLPRNPPLK